MNLCQITLEHQPASIEARGEKIKKGDVGRSGDEEGARWW